jgi:hypothetical protein
MILVTPAFAEYHTQHTQAVMRNYYQESASAPRRAEGYQRGAGGWKVIIRDTYQFEQPFLVQVVASKV